MADWTPYDLLPGAYVALLTVALAAVLRRGYDPVPWRILAVFAAVVVVLLGPCLVLGEILLPLDNLTYLTPFEQLPHSPKPGNYLQADLVHQMAPSRLEVRRAFAAGTWPLWSPGLGAGMPLLAGPEAQHFQPLTLLALPFPPGQEPGIVAALRLLVALVFCYLLLRRQSAGELPALAGSLAYGLGGFLLLWLGWPLANSAALLPLLLYAALRTVDEGQRRDVLLLTLTAASVLLAGHPETVLYAMVTAGLFGLSRVFAAPAAGRRKALGRLALAMLLGFGLAAPAVLPMLDYLPQSLRYNHGRDPTIEDLRAAWREPEARWSALGQRLLPTAAPNAFGNNRFGAFWGEVNINESAGGFSGSTALLAFFAGRSRRLPQERLVLGILVAAVVIQIQQPMQLPWLGQLPVLGSSLFRGRRIAMLLCFCIAYLAACTLERRRRGQLRGPPVRMLAAGLALVVTWAYVAHPHPEGRLETLRWSSLAVHLVTLAGTAGLLLAKPKRAGLASWGLASLVAAELLYLHGPINPPMPKRLFYPLTPPIEFLQENLGQARMLGLKDALPTNFASVYGLSDVRIYNSLEPYAYGRMVRPLKEKPGAFSFDLGRPEHPIHDLLGVRYVLVPAGLELQAPLRLVFRHPAGWIYERPGPLPLLFLPAAASIGTRPERWVARNPDFAAKVLVAATPERPGAWRAQRPQRSRLSMLETTPSRLRVRAELVEERLLASSVYQDGGWRILVDREPTPPVRTNGIFVSAWLPAGSHDVDLLYRPRGLLAGVAAAAIASMLALCWWLPRPGSGPWHQYFIVVRRSAGRPAGIVDRFLE